MMFMDNALVSPWVLIVQFIWQIFISLPIEFDLIKCLLKSSTCPVVLHSLSLVLRFVDGLFVPNFPDFENFMYLNQGSFGSGIYTQKHLVS
jgi:hypothetical protein